MCERRHTKDTQRETRGQEVRDRDEKSTGEEGAEAERRGRRETERETERVRVGEGGNAASRRGRTATADTAASRQMRGG